MAVVLSGLDDAGVVRGGEHVAGVALDLADADLVDDHVVAAALHGTTDYIVVHNAVFDFRQHVQLLGLAPGCDHGLDKGEAGWVLFGGHYGGVIPQICIICHHWLLLSRSLFRPLDTWLLGQDHDRGRVLLRVEVLLTILRVTSHLE